MSGTVALNLEALVRLSKALDFEPAEVSPTLAGDIQRADQLGFSSASGNSFDPSSYEMIQQSTAKVAAGHGEQNTHIDIDRALAFKKDWLKRKALRPADLVIVYVSGFSMFPIIQDGDAVLIDTHEKNLKHDRIFAFKDSEHEDIIKRAINEDGSWILRSDNPDKSVKEYRDMPFVDDEGVQRFEIVGVAKWRGGDL